MNKMIEKLAYQFTGQGKAMVYSEWTFREGVETVLSGDTIGILYIISCMIDRISQKTENSFDETISTIKMVHNPEGAKPVVDGDIGEVDEEFYVEKIREEIEAKEEKKYERLIKSLNSRVSSLEKNAHADASTIASLKLKMAEERKQAHNDNESLQREVRRKESEIRKLLAELADYKCLE